MQSVETKEFTYLYFENRIFINTHLLKEKLANVDGTLDFKCEIN